MLRLRFMIVAVMGLLAQPGAAEPPDPHVLFEQRCGGCHEHAGDLARKSLAVVDGELRGRESGWAIAPFLLTHKGGLEPADAAILHDLFVKQVKAGGLFQEKCGICHRSARGVVRSKLIVEQGVLRGRYTGRDMRSFLSRHGLTTAAEAEFLYGVLLDFAPTRR